MTFIKGFKRNYVLQPKHDTDLTGSLAPEQGQDWTGSLAPLRNRISPWISTEFSAECSDSCEIWDTYPKTLLEMNNQIN